MTYQHDNQAHWAEALRNAKRPSIEYWMYTVACYSQGRTEAEAREIAQIIIDTKSCVFHGVWIYAGKPGECPCSPCRRAKTSEAAHV